MYKGNRCSMDFEEIDEFSRPICSNQETHKLHSIMMEQIRTQHIEQEIQEFWDKLLKSVPKPLDEFLIKMPNSFEARHLKKMAVPEETVKRHLQNVKTIINLTQEDMINLLSFLMNLNLVNSFRRQHLMDLLQQRNVLTDEIVTYLELMAKRQTGAMMEEDTKIFLNICSQIKRKCFDHETQTHNYNLLFTSEKRMDLREFNYLRNILRTTGRLKKTKYLYLLNTVETLQDLPKKKRDQFFHILSKYEILKEPRLYLLKEFLYQHGRPFNGKKLQDLLCELEDLMDLESESRRTRKEISCTLPKFLLEQDLKQLKNSIELLKKCGTSNIEHLTFLKKFITIVLSLNDMQMEQYMKKLKSSNSLSLDDLNFMQSFITKENIEGADLTQLNKLMEVINGVCGRKFEKSSPKICPSPYIRYLTHCDLYNRRLAKKEEEEKVKELARRALEAQMVAKRKLLEGPKIFIHSESEEPTCEELLAHSTLFTPKKPKQIPKKKDKEVVKSINRYDDHKMKLMQTESIMKATKEDLAAVEKGLLDQLTMEKIAAKDKEATQKSQKATAPEHFSLTSVVTGTTEEVKETTETGTEGDTHKKRMPPGDLLSTRSRSSDHSGFFKDRTFVGKTNKIVSIRNGKLMLR